MSLFVIKIGRCPRRPYDCSCSSHCSTSRAEHLHGRARLHSFLTARMPKGVALSSMFASKRGIRLASWCDVHLKRKQWFSQRAKCLQTLSRAFTVVVCSVIIDYAKMYSLPAWMCVAIGYGAAAFVALRLRSSHDIRNPRPTRTTTDFDAKGRHTNSKAYVDNDRF